MEEEILARLEGWRKTAENGPTRNRKTLPRALGDTQTLFTPLDSAGDMDYLEELGMPGEYPFTRGVYSSMYRGKLWTTRQFVGRGLAEETNLILRKLMEEGCSDLAVAFDMPTVMGIDSDNPLALTEAGGCGVAVSSLEEMERLFNGIPLDTISLSMTGNGPAAILLAYYFVTAERQGVDKGKLRGTIQNDILKEYSAQKEYIFPPEPSLRLVTDTIAYCAEHAPNWHPVSICGYHFQEAGGDACQEAAFALANAFTYVESCISSGMDVDSFAPRLSFFFCAGSDFFEEIAKFRAVRRLYARRMREKYGARDPKSWIMRFHVQTSGSSLTSCEPENNIVRSTLQSLSAILGGVQSLHTNFQDEAIGMPSEKSKRTAMRTQQILAEETGVPDFIDPLGGSYLVETFTSRMEALIVEKLTRIDELGGVIPAINCGYFQGEIEESAFRRHLELDRGDRVVVGMKERVSFHSDENKTERVEKLDITDECMQRSRLLADRLNAVKTRRDQEELDRCLEKVRIAASGHENLMEPLMDAARAGATLGETVEALKKTFGEYTASEVF